jgi:tetratricopeptide (TPR) repeat protein
MGVRFRRSIKIAPGVRLNFTKTGIGATFSGKGARYSVHSSGRRTVGVGLPGTGTYYQKSAGGRRSGGGQSARGGSRPQAAAPISPIQAIPKPGFFASGAERAYHAGLLSYLGNDSAAALASFEKVVGSDPAAVSAHLFAGVAASVIGDAPRSIAHLEAVVGSQVGLPDRYQAKYMPASIFNLGVSVRITDSITAASQFGNLAAVLALAEAYQSAGRLEEAIGLMQQIHEIQPNDELVRLSLCDLLYADGDNEAVIEMSAGVTNDSDADVETMHLRGAAFVATSLTRAALDAFTAALAETANRDAGLLNAVRYDRALLLVQLGQSKRARDDLERIYAVDPTFEDVKDRLTNSP